MAAVSISIPNNPATAGTSVCVTVSGVTAPPPDIRIRMGTGAYEIATNVTPLGNGQYLVCFTPPAGTKSVSITAADGSGGSARPGMAAVAVF